MTGKPIQKVGYIRVSTDEQNIDRQLVGLELDKVFIERASAKDTNRPELQEMLLYVRTGDDLYVDSIDRLARNLADLISLVDQLKKKGVTVRFLKENLTFNGATDAMSTMLLGVMGSLAQFERAILHERQAQGIRAAQLRGVYSGRGFKLSSARAAELRARVAAGGESKAAIARDFGIHPTTLYDYLKRGAS